MGLASGFVKHFTISGVEKTQRGISTFFNHNRVIH